MLAVNYSKLRNHLKEYCDKVSEENETVIITRKDEKNVVIISLDEYNSVTKAARNAIYSRKLDMSIEQIESGNVVKKSIADLEAMEHE